MSAILLVFKDKRQLAKAPIEGNNFTIGRSPKCQLTLDETLASRQHAEIIKEGGAFWIQDSGKIVLQMLPQSII